jgi:hypothetical protein
VDDFKLLIQSAKAVGVTCRRGQSGHSVANLFAVVAAQKCLNKNY